MLKTNLIKEISAGFRKRIFVVLVVILFLCINLQAQTIEGITVRATVVDGDTIAYMSLPIVRVYAPKVFKSKKQEKQWNKLIRNVKKVYPYAVVAAEKMKEYEAVIISVKSEKEQKRLMKIAEEELKKEFEKDIRDMTFSQGKILIKLIDRETGATSYAIIREFRGTLSAFFWQSIAKLFGANLKDEYDPTGEDKMIEEIVIMIERGDL